MAKIKRLFPHWRIPTPDEVEVNELKIAVEHAVNMSKEVPKLLDILPLEQMMQAIEIPQGLRDLLRLMMVVDPSVRPSALSVLTSRDFRGFQDYVSV